MKLPTQILLLFALLMAACSPGMAATPGNPAATVDNSSFQLLTRTITPTPAPSQTPTLTPTVTPSPTLTFTPSPSPTPTWEYMKAGTIQVPILLYHHVSNLDPTNRYYVTPEQFQLQMEKLRDWGYATITISQMVEVMVHGGTLPGRPVVISFDDGNIDIYDNAYPIMQKLGFVGVFFIVSNRLGVKDFVNKDQLVEMANNGWEIGSHSLSHVDLTQDHTITRREVLQSRVNLEKETGLPVKVFAYPFGLTDTFISQKVQDYGYRAAVGLGVITQQSWSSLYYLNRREDQGDFDMQAFEKLLPWQGSTP